MATTTKVKLTEEQKGEIAKGLRIKLEDVPDEIGIVAIPPEAGEIMGLPKDMKSKFAPAIVIT